MLNWLSRLLCRRMLRRLRELEGRTDEILHAAREERERPGGAVNWGANVCCFQAEDWIAEDGSRGQRVWIQKASPDATELQEYVRKALAERGFLNIEVRTEW